MPEIGAADVNLGNHSLLTLGLVSDEGSDDGMEEGDGEDVSDETPTVKNIQPGERIHSDWRYVVWLLWYPIQRTAVSHSQSSQWQEGVNSGG